MAVPLKIKSSQTKINIKRKTQNVHDTVHIRSKLKCAHKKTRHAKIYRVYLRIRERDELRARVNIRRKNQGA